MKLTIFLLLAPLGLLAQFHRAEQDRDRNRAFLDLIINNVPSATSSSVPPTGDMCW